MRLPFAVKLGAAISLLSVGLTLAAVSLFYDATRNMLLASMHGRLSDVGHTGSFLFGAEERQRIKRLHQRILNARMHADVNKLDIEPGDLDSLLSEDMEARFTEDPDFLHLVQILRQIKSGSSPKPLPLSEHIAQNAHGEDNQPLISFTYLIVTLPDVPDHSVVMFLADSDWEAFDADGDGIISPEEEANPPGSLYAPPEDFFAAPFRDARIHVSPDWYSDRWGTFISASIPIVDEHNRVIAVLGVDYLETGDGNKLRQLRVMAMALTAGGLVLALLLSVLFAQLFNRPIRALVAGAERVRAGNLDTRVNVNSRDELGRMADTFNAMVEEIRRHTTGLEDLVRERTADLEQANTQILGLNEQLRSDNRRMAAELDVARQLQTMVLPHDEELRSVPGFAIAAHMKAADEVGGDYYDVLKCSEGGTLIGIGDVSGHGLESGVIMLMVQTAVRTLMLAGRSDLQPCYEAINRLVYHNTRRIGSNRIMTLSLLHIDAEQRIQVTGQHEDILVIRADGSIEHIDTMDLGLPLGLEEDIHLFCASSDVSLNPNDLLLLHTDGISEAENSDGEQYGLQRLAELACRVRQHCAADIKLAVLQELQAFIGEQTVYDDVTLVVIKRLP